MLAGVLYVPVDRRGIHRLPAPRVADDADHSRVVPERGGYGHLAGLVLGRETKRQGRVAGTTLGVQLVDGQRDAVEVGAGRRGACGGDRDVEGVAASGAAGSFSRAAARDERAGADEEQ